MPWEGLLGGATGLVAIAIVIAVVFLKSATEKLVDGAEKRFERTLQMARDLLPIGSIAITQFPPNVLARFGQKGEYGLKAFLSFVFRVIALACAHLLAIHGVHRGVGVQRDRLQPYVGCFPHPFAQDPLQLQ
jgi:Na+/H+-dicarboxylate symporter